MGTGFTKNSRNAIVRTMISFLTLAVKQLPDPRFRSVLLRSLGGALILYIGLYILAGWGLAHLAMFDIGWLDTTISALGGVVVFVVSLLLFPTISVILMSLMLDDVVAAVEEKHYPGLPPARQQKIKEMVWVAIRFALVALAINLVAMPFYIALMIVGFGIILFYLINSYMLSREYFEMVALRRLTPAEVDRLRRSNRGKIWLFGIPLTFLSTLPLVNLVAPLISVAAMTHLVAAIAPDFRKGISIP